MLLTVVTYDVAGLSQPQRPAAKAGLETASPACAAIVTRWLGKLGPMIAEKDGPIGAAGSRWWCCARGC